MQTQPQPHQPPPGAAAQPVAARQHLLFMLEDETFGLEISSVREILEYGNVTSVPMMPMHVKGVINLRGRVLPIIDLKSRFGRGPLAVGRRTSVVVVELPQPGQPPLPIGVMVSGVSEVVEFTADSIEPPPSLGSAIKASFISGMARHRERFVILLELGSVLSLEELTLAVGPGAAHADHH
jgi:purine-binding chemotaxis protein CheW